MAEQRYLAVLAVIEDGLDVTEVVGKVGVSRQTLHRWLSRYAAGGLEALADRSHRPRSCPHQMDAAVAVRVVELRALHPGWGADRLRYRLAREGFDPLPSRAAISRALGRLTSRPTATTCWRTWSSALSRSSQPTAARSPRRAA